MGFVYRAKQVIIEPVNAPSRIDRNVFVDDESASLDLRVSFEGKMVVVDYGGHVDAFPADLVTIHIEKQK